MDEGKDGAAERCFLSVWHSFLGVPGVLGGKTGLSIFSVPLS